MNREILFKAKRKDNGEYVEGYYIYHIKRTICPLGDTLECEGDAADMNKMIVGMEIIDFR